MSRHATRKRTDHIVIHCTATPEGRHEDVNSIDRMHRARGFNGIGYHYLILLDGTVQMGRPVDAVGAHVAGHNSSSVGVAYVGGVTARLRAKDTRTDAQKDAMERLVKGLLGLYPGAEVLGHRDFPGVAKDCPCFDVRSWWKSVQG